MFASRQRGPIILGLLTTIFLWGGNNAGVKFLVQTWPPLLVGSTRFFVAGLLMLAILRLTSASAMNTPLTPPIRKQLWLRGGLSLAAYVALFNTALRYTAAAHVAIYLAASPVWALVLEGHSPLNWKELRMRYAAALLALSGVGVLFWPVLKSANGSLRGELLGLAASVLWTNYGRQCRVLGQSLSGAEVSAHTMFRAGILLAPLATLEVLGKPFSCSPLLVGVQLYCILGGGILAFAFWNNALRHWKTSEVFLFNNLIPLSTVLWAHFCLGERIGQNFWLAMVLVIGGVLVGQRR